MYSFTKTTTSKLSGKKLFALALCCSTALTAAPTIAADINWTGATGDWATAGNWNAGVPTAADTAIIDNDGTAQIGTGVTATASEINLGVTNTKAGNLTISDGGTITVGGGTGTINLGVNSGAKGIINIGADKDSAAAAPGTLNAGSIVNAGSGSIYFNHTSSDYSFDPSITVGNSVSLYALSGTTKLNGNVTKTGGFFGTNIHINGDSSTVLEISNGNSFEGGNSVYVGNTAGKEGKLIVDGAGTNVTAGGVDVGKGDITIRNGADVDFSSRVLIGLGTSSEGTVSVSGSGTTLDVNAHITVGYGSNSNGSFSVLNGAQVTQASSFELGYISATASGTALISGSGSSLSTGVNSFIGASGGTGVVTLGDSATWRVDSDNDSSDGYDGTVNIANTAGSNGTLAIGAKSGEAAKAAGTLTAGNITFGAGTGKLIFNHTNTDYVFSHTINGDASGTETIVLEAGTTRFSGDMSDFQTDGGDIHVDGNNTAILDVSNNSQTKARYIHLGKTADKEGKAVVDGQGSVMHSGILIVGASSGTGTLEIKNSGDVTNDYADIGSGSNGTGTVNVDGNGSLWATTIELDIGASGTGTLNITGSGNVTSKQSNIGRYSGSTGTVNVDGDGSLWNSTSGLIVGYLGTGTLNITGGGDVTNTSGDIGLLSTGTVNVAGTGSKWTSSINVKVGFAGTGTLNIANSGQVQVDNDANSSNGYGGTVTVATMSGSTGTLAFGGASGEAAKAVGTLTADNITFGAGTGNLVFNHTHTDYVFSHTINGDASGTETIILEAGTTQLATDMSDFATDGGNISVDGNSTAILDVSNNSQTKATNISIGKTSGKEGKAVVDSEGSLLSSTSLYIGESGTGTLNITNSGDVTNATGYVGTHSGSTGTVTVDGDGSLWTNSSELRVGNGGTGTLNITNSGDVTSATSFVGGISGSTGTINVDGNGSLWANSSTLSIGYGGTGTLNITNSGDVTNTDGFVGKNSGSTGTVTVDGTGSLWANSSSLAVGDAGTGTLNITNSGQVQVDIDSDSSNGYGGTLTIAQTSSATGTVNIGAASGEAAKAAGTLTAGNITFGAGTGKLVFNHTNTDYVLSQDINGGAGTETIILEAGTTRFSGDMSDFQTDSGKLYVDGNSTAILDVSNNSQTKANGIYIGKTAGKEGKAVVDGEGSAMNSSSLYIGDAGTGTLEIKNSGDVISSDAYIGDSSAAIGTVNVDGDGSLWQNSSSLYIGIAGTGTLNITGSGDVTNTSGHVGFASTGTVNVDGDGSLWQNSSDINVGYHGTGTGTLNINNSGDVTSSGGHIGRNADSTGTVNVDGDGSLWTNSSDMNVGSSGTGTLNITGNGDVTNTAGYIGKESGSTGTVTVDGAGSLWANSSDLYVGNSGTGTLNINNNGEVAVNNGAGTVNIASQSGSTGTINIGAASGEAAKAVGTLTAGNITFGAGTGKLVFNHTATDYVLSQDINGGTGSESITLEAGTTRLSGNMTDFATDGGKLYVDGNNTAILDVSNAVTVKNSRGYVGYTSGKEGKAVVDGNGSLWATTTELHIGASGTGTLDIKNSGDVTSQTAYVAMEAGSTGTVNIDGDGSLWANVSSIGVGHTGTGTLNINNSGDVTSRDGYVGYNSAATGTVNVDGSGSKWANNDGFIVGQFGTGTLNISNGGVVENTQGTLGNAGTATGTATVDGTGSKWTNSGNVIVGNLGSGTLTIANSGNVSANAGSGTVHIAVSSGKTGTINIGAASGEAAVAAGTLTANNITFGAGTGKLVLNHTANNYVLSADINGGSGTETITLEAGTTRINGDMSDFQTDGGSLYVDGNSTAILDVSNAVTVKNNFGYLGNASGKQGKAVVDGNGSLWANSSELRIGGLGTGTLEIKNSGDVTSSTGTVGASTGSTGTVTVNGDGSLWAMSSTFDVGYFGTGTLNINNSGDVTNTSGVVGSSAGTTGTVNVDGEGSKWANSSLISIGLNGTGVMNLTNGGDVENTTAYVGNASGSTGTVTVDGNGSLWANSSSLYVGRNGTGTLNITNSGDVTNTAGYIGRESGSTGTVTVDGDGSLWANSANLYLGRDGTGTLNIKNNGDVTASGILLGHSTSTTGTLNIDGAGSKLTAPSDAYIGYEGKGTIKITNAGAMKTDKAVAGDRSTGSGTITVDGDGSLWEITDDIMLGNFGKGTLTIKNGGDVTSERGRIAWNSDSTGAATVDGEGSTWNSSSVIDVGHGGTGTLNITSGGNVTGLYGSVGSSANAAGTVNIDGSGSKWDISNGLFAEIGSSGTGTVNLSNGGNLTVGNGTKTLEVAKNSGSTGTINIGAAAGQTAKGAGTILADKIAFGAGTGTLNFNHTSTALDFTLPVTGSGAVNLTGGATELTGDFSGHTGGISINGGTLIVNTDWSSRAFSLIKGGIKGTGTLPSITAPASGITMAPGNSIGTQTINGNLTLNDNSTFEVEFNKTAADKLIVTGTATIAGTVKYMPEQLSGVDANGNPIEYDDGKTFTILTANEVTGKFANEEISNKERLSGLTVRTDIDELEDKITMLITRGEFQPQATPTNSASYDTAGYIDSLRDKASGDLEFVFDCLAKLPVDELDKAMESVSGKRMDSTAKTEEVYTKAIAKAVQARQLILTGGSLGGGTMPGAGTPAPSAPTSNLPAPSTSDTPAPASDALELMEFGINGTTATLSGNNPLELTGNVDGSVPLLDAGTETTGVWVRGFGQVGSKDSDMENTGYDFTLGGFVGGLDHAFSDKLTAGIMFGTGQSNVNLYDNTGGSDIRTWNLGGYATYAMNDGYFADGLLMLGYNEIDSQRHISFTGVNRWANGATESYTVRTGLGLGKRIERNGYTLIPSARIGLLWSEQQSYTEKGAQAMNLHYETKRSHTLYGEIGAEANKTYKLESGELKPYLGLSVTAEDPLDRQDTYSGFVGAASYAVKGDENTRYGISPRAGVVFKTDSNVSWVADYSGDFDRAGRSNSFSAGVRIGF